MRLVLMAVMLCAACGSTGATAANATIQITSPAAGATVTAAADHTVPIAFTVGNFALKAAGTCGGAANCGHVHVLVDGATCNDPAAAGPYNNDGNASPISIKLDKCPTATGSHLVTAELHNDNHSFYKDAQGNFVTSAVSITVN